MSFKMRWAVFILICLCDLTTARAQGVAADYKLSPMDKLSISVAQDPVTGKPVEISVSPLGDLTVPVSRCCEDSITIRVAGKTVDEAEKELKAKLEADFYQTATVQ